MSRKRFVGIDLGTSNSAIASYQDGNIRVWKDPQQQDVTASVIWIGKRGNKKIGNPAYSSAQTSPEYGLRNFKRFIGSDTKLPVKAFGQEWTPEQCSAEILRELYSYIPPEVQSQCGGVVVTVPAAFDQSQKNATLAAAESAGIGQVTLLQEPVAAVMAATRNRTKPAFLAIYDIGGGTLDVAIAEWTRKGITLHAHGGIAMLGGRDIDRAIRKKKIEPWLESKFDMPENWKHEDAWEGTLRLCDYAAEQAKIRLSSLETTTISIEEDQLLAQDAGGTEIYLDIPIGRDEINMAIEDMVDRSIEAVREALQEGGFESKSVEELIFIGGPTHYEPLRRKVCDALGIQGSTETDPMTAVAVGAAIFAENVNWETGSRSQTKRQREHGKAGEVRYDLNYDKRVTTEEIKVRVLPTAKCKGATLELVSEQTGWTTGETDISTKTSIPVRVSQMGENTYEAIVKKGGQRSVTPSAVRVTRSLSSVSAVPLTKSIGIGVIAGKGRRGRTKMRWLARRGDELPVKGSVDLFATQALESGEERSINLKVYTGEHDKPEDNQAHGVLRIMGTDLNEGKLNVGSRLECHYSIREGGQLTLTVKAPDIRQEFRSDHNYYAHQEGAMDYRSAAGSIREDAEQLSREVEEAQNFVDDKRLRRAQVLLDEIDGLSRRETDPEIVKDHHDRAEEAKNLLAVTRKQHRSTLLQLEVEKVRAHWNDEVVAWAEDRTKERVAKLFDAATKGATVGDDDCEDRLEDIRTEIWDTLWKEDWYVVELYKSLRSILTTRQTSAEVAVLIEKGDSLNRLGDTELLRTVVGEMISLVHGEQGDPRWLLEDINVRAA